MKTLKFETEEEWMEARRGKITGSKLKGLVSKRDGAYLTGFYDLVAERICLPPTNENPMDRGKRLEEVAIEAFCKKTGKKVNTDLVMWVHDEFENIALSPDGVIGKTEAVEVKCLKSAIHIETYLTKEIPKEYETQIIQYFVVNEKLKKLHFVMFDPRMPIDMFVIEKTRAELKEEIKYYLMIEEKALAKAEELEAILTF